MSKDSKIVGSRFILKVLSFLMIGSLFTLHSTPLLRVPGNLFFYTFILVALLHFAHQVFIRNFIDRKIFTVFNLILALAVVYLLSGLFTGTLFHASIRFLQIISVIGVVSLFSRLSRNESNILLDYSLTRYFYIFNILLSLLIISFSEAESVFGFQNNNSLGIWLAVTAPIAAISLKRIESRLLYWVIIFAAILFTGSRTSFFALLGGCLLIMYWPIISKRAALLWFCLLLICVISILAVISLYVDYLNLEALNILSRETTQKNFLSGRDVIWPILIDLALQKPWFGWGGGMLVGDMLEENLSAHNTYIQTFMQVGAVGLILLIIALLKISRFYIKHANYSYASHAFASFVVVLLIQNFEITMFQNNLVLSYPMWAIMGVFFGCLNKPRSTL